MTVGIPRRRQRPNGRDPTRLGAERCGRSKERVQLDERSPAVLQVVLRNAVVEIPADAQLHELHRSVFPQQRVAVLFVLVDVDVWLVVLDGGLEVLALAQPPVGLEVADPELAAVRKPANRFCIRRSPASASL